jgi:hypothetical protein
MRRKIIKLTGAIAHRVAGTLVYALTTVVYAIGGRKLLDKCNDWLIKKLTIEEEA